MFGKKSIIATAVGAVLLASTSAMAILPAGELAVVDALTTKVTDLTTAGWILVLAVLGFMLGVRLVKKILGRSI